MGIDAAAVQFLFAARVRGVDFSKTATLGRQTFFPNHSALIPIAKAFGSPGGAEHLLDECGKDGNEFLRILGARAITSFDASNYEGASIVHDMNHPVPVEHHGKYSVVFDGGTIEHVFNAPQALMNCLRMVSLGGHFLSITTSNNFSGHGFYQFSPEFFFRSLTVANGFEIISVMVCTPYSEPPEFYAVSDPEVMNGRVELVNVEPVYILTIALRTSIEDELFSNYPQQSDYVSAWKQRVDDVIMPPIAKKGAVRTSRHRLAFVKAILPTRFKVLFDRIRKQRKHRRIRERRRAVALSKGFDQFCYHPLKLEDMARGIVSPPKKNVQRAVAVASEKRT